MEHEYSSGIYLLAVYSSAKWVNYTSKDYTYIIMYII